MSKKRKLELGFTIILVLIIIALVLCNLHLVPDVDLKFYKIECHCNEKLADTKVDLGNVQNQLKIIKNDTIEYRKKLREVEERIAIIERNKNAAENRNTELETELDSLNMVRVNLLNLLNISNHKADSLQKIINILGQKSLSDSTHYLSNLKYYKDRYDSLQNINNIFTNVHLINIKASTDRKFFLQKSKVTKINITYTLIGIDSLKKYIHDSSFVVTIKIKDEQGNYKEYGEMNPKTMGSLHIQASDVLSIKNIRTNEITTTVSFPNWQSAFNIHEKYIIEAYIIISGTSIFVGSEKQNLTLNEKIYSLSQ